MTVLVMLLLALCSVCVSGQKTVELPGLGKLQGIDGQSYFSSRTIHNFMGIPYAEPPIDDLRFVPPVKKSAWNDTRNATSYGRMCPQLSTVYKSLRNVFKRDAPDNDTSNTKNSEDCLFLDVYSPKMDNDSKLPVLFYIHGGSFVEGTSQNIKPDFLLEHDIVLVAPQYRLGPLGFLRLNAENATTGNAGMYDLLMALEWTRDHIQHFGGDPERITISGISAGAAAAALLYVSPKTQDIIKQALLLSGSAVAPWVLDSDPVTHSRAIATHAGCNATDSDDDLLYCLQQIENPIDLMAAYYKHAAMERMNGRHGMGGTIPVIDDEFLKEMPLATLSKPTFKGRPMLMSVAKNEGIFLADTLKGYYFDANNLTSDANVLADILKYDIGEILLGFSDVSDPTHTIAAAIQDVYFQPDILGNLTAMMPGIIDFVGAAYFKGPALKMAELNALLKGPTFLTTFNFYSQESLRDGGVNHAADQKFLFPYNVENYTESENAMVRKLTKLYSNFVINGAPTVDTNNVDGLNKWESYSRSENVYLSIEEDLVMKRDFEQEFTVMEIERRGEKHNSASTHLPHHYLLVALFLTCIYTRLSSDYQLESKIK